LGFPAGVGLESPTYASPNLGFPAGVGRDSPK
jgi:hypothetical protein